MVMYNSDGSRAQMCGNGIRCVGKYVYDRGLTRKTPVTVETLAGIKTLELQVENGQVAAVTVDMGAPILTPKEIPVAGEGARFLDVPVLVDGVERRITAVSMGNPHAIVFVEDTDSLDLPKIGPAFEHHAIFPERTNTEFVQVVDRNTLKMRVWERGAGETLACGTGACASLVAAVLCGKADREATLQLLGGDLHIRWDEATDHVFMTGPATTVFDGEIQL
jgi:diaminopimelate epimerase